MAHVEVNRAHPDPPPPPVESFVLTLTPKEALYIAAELGGSNTTWHGLGGFTETPYFVLHNALLQAGLKEECDKHAEVANAHRPGRGGNGAAEKVSRSLGITAA